tara:strand:+ start:390 stop:905 length:516 start_codon:yes stop_codon:yes gene_type:complete
MAVKSLIQTVTVGAGGAASIEFTAIPQSGSELILVISNRVDANQFEGQIQFNGDTASNYSAVRLFTNGNGIFTGSSSGTGLYIYGIGRADATANTFASASIYVSNYTSSVAKTVSTEGVSENNNASAFSYLVGIGGGKWSGTAAITSLKLFAASSNFVQHTTASLFKIKYD